MRQSDTQLRTATKNREEAAARVRCVVVNVLNGAAAVCAAAFVASTVGTKGAALPMCGLALGALVSFALAAFAVTIGREAAR